MGYDKIIGYINSIQTLGTLDGPGVRFVLFMQGCPLRCACCHNPDTWDAMGGEQMSVEDVFAKIKRYKEYFGTDGGVTVSGGEALLQADFVTALFSLCKKDGISTCLDTSGCLMNSSIDALLDLTDIVLLDIKYTKESDYIKYVGCSADKPLEFLAVLQHKNIRTWIRQVLINTINDDKDNLHRLSRIARAHTCVEKIELLAFRKLCVSKYDELSFDFPFAYIDETTPEKLLEYQSYLDKITGTQPDIPKT